MFILSSLNTFASGAGIHWSAAKALNSTAADDFQIDDSAPAIGNDGAGTWLTVWQAHRSTVGNETDWDILFARSTDKAASWSAVASLNTDAGTDSTNDTAPFAAAGSSSVWLAFWVRSDITNSFIAGARSVDGGQSWNAPYALSTPVPTTFGYSVSIMDQPHAASDGRGTWVAVWSQQGGIFWTRSTNNGVSWGAPTTLITTPRTLPDNVQPRVSTDGAGNWLVVWSHFGALNGIYDDRIILRIP
ncbi:MAG: exo-alpha-sialidase [Candidatus Hydrogenedentes bacterium]|nr:exo-alpha-sialidase [Candidatus Hydrogenedentota bacterium]